MTILRCPGMWFWHEVLHIEWFVFKAYTSYTLHCLGPFAGAILFTGLQEHGGGFMSTWWFLVGSLNLWTWGQRARVRVGCPSRWVGLQCESPNDFQIMQLKHWSCFFPFLSRNYIALWIPLMPFVFCIWAIWIDMTWCDEHKRFIVPPPWETNSIQSLWSRPCKGGRFLAHGRSEGGRGQRRSLWEEQVVVGWCGDRHGFVWKNNTRKSIGESHGLPLEMMNQLFVSLFSDTPAWMIIDAYLKESIIDCVIVMFVRCRRFMPCTIRYVRCSSN